MHRYFAAKYSAFSLPRSALDDLVLMGTLLHRLALRFQAPLSYNFYYMTIVNPQALKRLTTDLEITSSPKKEEVGNVPGLNTMCVNTLSDSLTP